MGDKKDMEEEGVFCFCGSFPCLAQEPARLEEYDYDGDDDLGRELVLQSRLIDIFPCFHW